jgi:hypothetical protein
MFSFDIVKLQNVVASAAAALVIAAVMVSAAVGPVSSLVI